MARRIKKRADGAEIQPLSERGTWYRETANRKSRPAAHPDVVHRHGWLRQNAGFDQPQKPKQSDLTSAKDVHRLVCLYQPPFWKNYRPELADKIEGFKFNLFCISRRTNKGVLTDATLQTRVFLRRHMDDGTIDREQVYESQQSLLDTTRSRREMELGWVYQPHYFWGDLDLEGEEIEIVVWLETADGHKVHAKPKTLRVPDQSRV